MKYRKLVNSNVPDIPRKTVFLDRDDFLDLVRWYSSGYTTTFLSDRLGVAKNVISSAKRGESMKVAKEILQLTANADVREVFEVTLPVSPDGLPASVKNLDYKEVADG